jgi:hypothetical protein
MEDLKGDAARRALKTNEGWWAERRATPGEKVLKE